MTNKEMTRDILRSAKSARDILRSAKSARKTVKETYPAGTKIVDINYALPYIGIICPDGSEYFFQGEEAGNLLEEVVATSNKFNVSVEDVLIWKSQSW